MEHETGKYFTLRPEVAGGLGSQTVMDRSTHPPVVSQLHYELEDWLGDCLVQSFPCFLVLRSTAARLTAEAYSGFRLSAALVTTSDLYQEINPEGTAPELDWLIIYGQPGRDDFGLTSDNHLVVSSRVLDLLRAAGLTQSGIEPWTA